MFTNANALTIFLDAGTDYVNQRSQNWRGKHPHEAITARLEKASAASFDSLLSSHVADYKSLFDRLTLDVGATAEAVRQLPTDKRLTAYRGSEAVVSQGSIYDGHKVEDSGKGLRDPELEVLLLQYAALPDDQLFPARRSARQPAGPVEQQQQSAVEVRLPQQRQRPDELLVCGRGQSW